MSLNSKGMKGVAQGVFSDITSAADARRAEHAFVGRYLSKKFTDGEIGTNVNLAESPVAKMKYAGTVLNSCIIPGVNLALNASNYVYFALSKSTGGAASTLVASLNTATQALTKWVPQALTLNVNGVTYSANDVFTMTATKYMSSNTTAVTVTSSTAEATWDVDVEEGY